MEKAFRVSFRNRGWWERIWTMGSEKMPNKTGIVQYGGNRLYYIPVKSKKQLWKEVLWKPKYSRINSSKKTANGKVCYKMNWYHILKAKTILAELMIV